MKLLKNIIIFSISVFAGLCILAIGVNFIVTTNTGAKLLLNTALTIGLHNNMPCNVNINKISGSLHKELFLENFSLDTIDQINFTVNLHIKTATIKVNWIDLIKKQQLSIKISNLQGTLNNYPLEANINFSTGFFTKKPNDLYLNTQNFIKIGNNILNLEQPINAEQINFKLTANQLDVFNNIFNKPLKLITGKIIITGHIANSLTNVTANIRTERLNINNIALDPILQNPNNQLNIVLKDIKTIEAQINFQDITPIMTFIPNITRLKGKLQGFIHLDHQSKLKTNLALKDITMSLPEYGIKIKPLNINFTANDTQTVFINGKGIMRQGPGEFTLKGHLEPFSKNIPNILEISGDNIECINIPGYHLIASLKLKLVLLLQQSALQITGNIIIPNGSINLDQQKSTSIVKSKDIVFIEQTGNSAKNNFRILPNIDLRIESKTKLLGKGLDTTISGKLKIYTENDIVLGDGRVSIKQGTYKLSGQEFIIEKGRFIYLPGTLIANPSLDIKILPKNKQQQDQYLYIEGTLNDPVIKDSGLANEHQAMLQLLSFGSDKIITSIKEKLHLHEFGVEEDNYISNQYKIKNHDESVLSNKNFVVGKKINDKLHIQYLKTLNTTNNTVRLKYIISPRWSLGIETSTESGHGADLGFSLDK